MSTHRPTDRRRPSPSVVTLALLTVAAAAQEANSPFAAATIALPIDSAPFQRLFDFDGDGDLDAVGTRVATTQQQAQLAVWRNDGGAYTSVWSLNVVGSYPTNSLQRLAVATGDFDGNGREDFVASGGSTTWKVMSSAAGFHVSTVPTPIISSRVHGAAAGDFDGDGVDDFAIAVRSSTGILVEVHLATGAVVSTTVPSVFGDPELLAASVQGGSTDQIIVWERTSSTLGGFRASVLGLLSGQLQLQQTVTATLPASIYEPLWMAGDLEGDGDADLVVFRKAYSGAASYQVFRSAAGTLAAEPTAFGGPAEYLADVDGDGDLDGVCCSGGGGGGGSIWPMLDIPSTFEIAINTGSGFARAFEMPGQGSRSLAGAADIDGDGDVDLVAGRCVFYGRGPWTVNPIQPPVATHGGLTLLSALPSLPPRFDDLDGDTDPDLRTWAASWINRGDGVMTTIAGDLERPVAPPGRAFLAGTHIDFNGDGIRDLVAFQFQAITTEPYWQFEQITGLRNNGAGHFDNVGNVSVPGASLPPFWEDVRAADLDGDGDEDLYTLWQAPGGFFTPALAIYWNENGTLVPGLGVAGHHIAYIWGLADFDGDGIDDALMYKLTSAGGQTGVFHGTGDHTIPFVYAARVQVHSFNPQAFAIGDVNGDGKPDVLAADPSSSYAVVLYTNTTAPGGPITFATTTLPMESNNGIASIADLDGDGLMDIVMAQSQQPPHAYIAMLRTSTAVPVAADFRFAEQLLDGAATDVDGDGDIDMLGTRPVLNARFHGAAAGRRIQEGIGSVGEGGSRPLLGAIGPFRTGVTERVLLRGVPGPSIAVLGYALAPANMPDFPFLGTTLLVDPNSLATLTIALPVPSEGRGAGYAELPVTLPPGLFGVTFYEQFYCWDPTAPASITCSNRVVKTVGL